jgi:hypothetical protein
MSLSLCFLTSLYLAASASWRMAASRLNRSTRSSPGLSGVEWSSDSSRRTPAGIGIRDPAAQFSIPLRGWGWVRNLFTDRKISRVSQLSSFSQISFQNLNCHPVTLTALPRGLPTTGPRGSPFEPKTARARGGQEGGRAQRDQTSNWRPWCRSL